MIDKETAVRIAQDVWGKEHELFWMNGTDEALEAYANKIAEHAVNEDRVVQNKGWLKIVKLAEKLAEEVEREAAVEFLMELHDKAKGKHNYYHCAANDLQDFFTDRADT